MDIIFEYASDWLETHKLKFMLVVDHIRLLNDAHEMMSDETFAGAVREVSGVYGDYERLLADEEELRRLC